MPCNCPVNMPLSGCGQCDTNGSFGAREMERERDKRAGRERGGGRWNNTI